MEYLDGVFDAVLDRKSKSHLLLQTAKHDLEVCLPLAIMALRLHVNRRISVPRKRSQLSQQLQ